MTEPHITGDEIKAWREQLGQARHWLADQLGVSAKTIESREYGFRNPGGPALRPLEILVKEHPMPNDDR